MELESLSIPEIKEEELTPLVKTLLKIVAQQQTIINEQSKRISELEAKVAKLEKNSSNSSKPPSSDITKPKSEQRQKGKRKKGGQKGHKANWRKIFEPEEIDKRRKIELKICPDCKGPLQQTGNTKTHQQAELVKKPVIVTEYTIIESSCPCCNKVVTPELPVGVIPKELLGPRLITLFGYMKAAMGVSITQLAEFSGEVLSLKLSRAAIQNTIFKVSDSLTPSYDELKEVVPKQKVLNIDETGWKENGSRYWVWVFCNMQIAFFTINKSRGYKVLAEVLGESYSGALISDFYSAYVKYASVKQQFCLAHLIRDIKYLTTLKDEKTKKFGLKMLAYMRRLFKLWHSRSTFTQEEWKKKTSRFRKEFSNYLWSCKFEKKTDANRIHRRCLKHFDANLRFLDDPDLYEPTNNHAERVVRHIVQLRRASQGSRSYRGRQWSAKAATALATCKLQKRSSWSFLLQTVNAHYFNGLRPSLVTAP